MENAIKPPGKIDFDDANLSHAWKRWKEEFCLYMDRTMEDKDDGYKVKLLYYLIGEKGREVCATLGVGRNEEDLYIDEVLAALDAFCDPRRIKLLKYTISLQEVRAKKRVWTNI